MKYFIFSDAHGFYSLLTQSLKKAGFDECNDDHMLISLGDNFDRGEENFKMFLFLKEMKEKEKIVLLKGNHEDLLMDAIDRQKITYIDVTNGTFGTIEEFSRTFFGEDKNEMFFDDFPRFYNKLKETGLFDLISGMGDFYETNHYVFTHGFIPVKGSGNYQYKEDWRKSSPEEFKRSRWINGMDMSMNHSLKEEGKKIVVGHFHTSYGNVRKKYGSSLPLSEYRELEFSDLDLFSVYEDDSVIAIDACTAFSKKMNILVIDD